PAAKGACNCRTFGREGQRRHQCRQELRGLLQRNQLTLGKYVAEGKDPRHSEPERQVRLSQKDDTAGRTRRKTQSSTDCLNNKPIFNRARRPGEERDFETQKSRVSREYNSQSRNRRQGLPYRISTGLAARAIAIQWHNSDQRYE